MQSLASFNLHRFSRHKVNHYNPTQSWADLRGPLRDPVPLVCRSILSLGAIDFSWSSTPDLHP